MERVFSNRMSIKLFTDEAVSTIGMVSEWLELDSPDEGVRYDSEIVRSKRHYY